MPASTHLLGHPDACTHAVYCPRHACDICWRSLLAEPYAGLHRGSPPTHKSCHHDPRLHLQAWVNEMAAYTKTQDPNHLLTVGIEGFYSEYDPQNVANPGNGWASLTGQNFTDQHSSPSIDFGAIHYWPDRWTLGVSPGLITAFQSCMCSDCASSS